MSDQEREYPTLTAHKFNLLMQDGAVILACSDFETLTLHEVSDGKVVPKTFLKENITGVVETTMDAIEGLYEQIKKIKEPKKEDKLELKTTLPKPD